MKINQCFLPRNNLERYHMIMNPFYNHTAALRPPPPPKNSIFVKKMKIEINAWEDSSSSALSETL